MKGETTTDTTGIQRIVRNYYEQLYYKKFENLDEMKKVLEKYNLPKLDEEEAQNLNRPITADEIEAVIKKLPAHKSPRWFHRRILQNISGRANPYPSQTIRKSPE